MHALFTAGRLSEYQVATIARATAHLSTVERAQVDEELAARHIERLGVRRMGDLARTLAAQVAPDKFAARCRAARAGRYVSTGVLAELIRARDGGRCREPYCDAPIRDLDHIQRRADNGPTSFDNGRGLCTFHNQVRETPGWHAENISGTIVTTTPTGHTYTSDVRNGTTAGRPRPQPEHAHAA